MITNKLLYIICYLYYHVFTKSAKYMLLEDVCLINYNKPSRTF